MKRFRIWRCAMGVDLYPQVAVRLESRQEDVAQQLAQLVEKPMLLTWTDNTKTMISVHRFPNRLQIRLHHMFADAPPDMLADVLGALAQYCISADRNASRFLGRYIERHAERIRRTKHRTRLTRRPQTLCAKGRTYDLGVIFQDLNQRYFGQALQAQIGWTARSRTRGRRSIRLGAYSVDDRLIRIHACLDQPYVPRYFVESVVYHEMLHQKHAILRKNGRRQFHTREFLQDERRFRDYDRAKNWEQLNVRRLLVG